VRKTNPRGRVTVLVMMASAARLTCVAVAFLAVGALAVPAFPQSNSASSAFFALERTSTGVARAYEPHHALHLHVDAMPPNLEVAPAFQSKVDLMLRRSSTFRRQCQRIANAPHLRVRLDLDGQPKPRGTRARTAITRRSGGTITAEIALPPLDDDVELIAHEFEHIIEQLDDVDLASKALRTGSGVAATRTDPMMFETTRAVRIGRIVAEEVRRARP